MTCHLISFVSWDFFLVSVESDNAPLDLFSAANRPESTDYNQDNQQVSNYS